MKNKLTPKIILIIGVAMTIISCSKLEDKSYSSISNNVTATFKPSEIANAYKESDAASTLKDAYNSLSDLSSQDVRYALQEHTSDEMVGPTRGTDWDDAGRWRKLNYHVWDGTTDEIVSSWDANSQGMYKSALAMLANKKFNNKDGTAQAQVLYAYNMLMQVDYFGQVPYRDLTTDDQPEYPKVLTRAEGIAEVIKNLEEALPNLTEGSPQTSYGLVTKDVCRMLLAKAYLNKHVFTSEAGKAGSPSTEDMTKVTKYMNDILTSGRYSLAKNYFDNFYWDNHLTSEVIFHMVNASGNTRGNVRSRWRMGTHYNQYANGWNGFSMIADFYNKFDATKDTRTTAEYKGFTDLTGMKVGILIGQQKNADGKNITDRSNNPLIFTPDFKNGILFATEAEGIRTAKYFPKIAVENGKVLGIDKSEAISFNDYVYFRLGDVYLMYAEAILRGGSVQSFGSAADAYNALRNLRVKGNTPVSTVTLDNILDERGRELYFEGFRRQDLIRFGKFNAPNAVRTKLSEDYRQLFPIPFQALASNPNLKQNAGY